MGGVMEESGKSVAVRGGEEKRRRSGRGEEDDGEENFLQQFQSCTDWIIVLLEKATARERFNYGP